MFSEGERKVRLGRENIQYSCVNDRRSALGIWGSVLLGNPLRSYAECIVESFLQGMGEARVLIHQHLSLSLLRVALNPLEGTFHGLSCLDSVLRQRGKEASV